MFKRYAVVCVIALVLVAGAPAAARAAILTDAQIQAITSLVSSFGADAGVVRNIETVLRGGSIGAVGGTGVGIAQPVMPVANEWKHTICKRAFSNIVREGTRGEEVKDIQTFLKDEGLFDREPTGFFGKLTAQALGQWQVQNSVVVSDGLSETALSERGFGIFGPKTREYVRTWCDRGHDRFMAEPQQGAAPLSVTFKAWVGGFTPFQFWLDFGDGSPREQVSCSAPADACIAPAEVKHTYTQDGIYTVVLYRTSTFSASDVVTVSTAEEVIGKKLIHVGGTQVCTKEYNPVCAQPNGCKISPNGTEMCAQPDQRTFANECMMKKEGATFLYEGQCKRDNLPYEPEPYCKAWYDGCNECARQTPGGPAACTLRACIWQAPGYCKEKFSGTTENKPPVISGFSGPTTVQVNEMGTWTITASDPENGNLNYQVTWGDERLLGSVMSALAPAESTFAQETTFTHAYSKVGMYTIIVIVRDAQGALAKTTTTVKVGETYVACTLEYKPVCGQPPEPACRHSEPACMLPTPAPQTYSNLCFMKAAGAMLLYAGECSSTVSPCTGEGSFKFADERSYKCISNQWVLQ
ncbi:MAG: hypothetical protein HYT30_02350 [Parcubacteria group bacterium]|nr:hypothetical protein [Parcubacteria group bacterium]